MINWFYFWRKMNALQDCKTHGDIPYGGRAAYYGIDVGYCLDARHEKA